MQWTVPLDMPSGVATEYYVVVGIVAVVVGITHSVSRRPNVGQPLVRISVFLFYSFLLFSWMRFRPLGRVVGLVHGGAVSST